MSLKKFTNYEEYENVYMMKLKKEYCEEILKNIKNKIFYLGSYKEYKISSNDIIIIYQTNDNRNNGFFGLFKICVNQQLNGEKIKVFKDINMHKYIMKFSDYFIFDNIIKYSNIQKKENTLKSAVFQKYLADNLIYIKFPNIKIIEKLINTFMLLINDNQKNDSESESESESSESESSESSESESSESSESESSDTEKKVNIKSSKGHIPVIMTPCKKFKWQRWKIEYKSHYKECNECDKTDNNNVQLLNYFNNKEIVFNEISDEEDDDLDDILDKYYVCENHYIDNKINVFIPTNKKHDYYRTFIAVY